MKLRVITILAFSMVLVGLTFGYYSPETGRFMTQDPLGIVQNDFHEEHEIELYGQYTDGLNLYQYGLNSPLVNSDPTGELIGRIIGCAVCLPALGWAAAQCYDELGPYRDACNSLGDPWDNKEAREEYRQKQTECLKEKLGVLKWCIRCGHPGLP